MGLLVSPNTKPILSNCIIRGWLTTINKIITQSIIFECRNWRNVDLNCMSVFIPLRIWRTTSEPQFQFSQECSDQEKSRECPEETAEEGESKWEWHNRWTKKYIEMWIQFRVLFGSNFQPCRGHANNDHVCNSITGETMNRKLAKERKKYI